MKYIFLFFNKLRSIIHKLRSKLIFFLFPVVLALSYPSFPKYSSYGSSNVGGYILALIFWFLSIPLVALGKFVEGLAGGVTSGASSSASSVLGFIGTEFVDSESSFSFAGPFAIVIASAVWGVAIIILIFFIFKGIQLALGMTTEDE
jgi:hypothetical protein